MKISLTKIHIIFAFIIFTTACSTAPERELSSVIPSYVMLPNGDKPLSPGTKSIVQQELHNALVERVITKNKPLQVLQLSGGGQNGAFGAGFLKGWSEAGTRPEFDIVTGVSTGTLISTFAFLGTPEDDAQLHEIWTGITKDNIYIDGGIGRLLTGGDSLYDSKPLKALLKRVITKDVIDRVAAEYDKGRRLLVSTTNLDYEQTWVWDLTALAKHGGEEALEIYIKALIASASPPILFPPVEIKGSLFADGGTKHNLLLVGLTGNKESLYQNMADDYNKDRSLGNIYTILHHKAHHQREPVREDIKQLIARSSGIMLSTSTGDTILRSYFITKLQGANFNLVHIPDDLEIDQNVLEFNPETMLRMYESGRAIAKAPQPWKHKPQSTGEIAPWLINDITERFEID
jgi:patatin-like phospholipase